MTYLMIRYTQNSRNIQCSRETSPVFLLENNVFASYLNLEKNNYILKLQISV